MEQSWTRPSHRGDSRKALQPAVSSSYLGRHIGLPVALEGALKRKEISYIPHRGVLGRRDEAWTDRPPHSDTPVVCIAIDQKVVYDKVVSNIQEVRARARR